jgi:hypothetical protein
MAEIKHDGSLGGAQARHRGAAVHAGAATSAGEAWRAKGRSRFINCAVPTIVSPDATPL